MTHLEMIKVIRALAVGLCYCSFRNKLWMPQLTGYKGCVFCPVLSFLWKLGVLPWKCHAAHKRSGLEFLRNSLMTGKGSCSESVWYISYNRTAHLQELSVWHSSSNTGGSNLSSPVLRDVALLLLQKQKSAWNITNAIKRGLSFGHWWKEMGHHMSGYQCDFPVY